MVTYTFTNGTVADADEVNQNFDDVEQDTGLLGEVRMFALSMTGAVTKASLQGKGWAICDGTTPVAQGITSPTIETTPDLSNRFIKCSDDETSGTEDASPEHNHLWGKDTSSGNRAISGETSGGNSYTTRSFDSSGSEENFYVAGGAGSGPLDGDYYTDNSTVEPPYYELAFFMKVKY